MKKFFLLLCAVSFTAILQGGVILETVEAAAKVSGRILSVSSKKAAEKILTQAVNKYGDDALKMVRYGGLEAIKHGAKYGDDFWRLTRHVTPQSARSLALHADDLMPIAKRLGQGFFQLESKVPGLTAQVVAEFGDDAAIHLAKNASPNDVSKLLGFAAKADSPATKKLLFDNYRKGGSSFLQKLDTKKILAFGLSASMITATYKVSDGIETGIEHIAKNDPQAFQNVMGKTVLPFQILIGILVIMFIWPLLRVWQRLFHFKQNKKQSAVSETTQRRE